MAERTNIGGPKSIEGEDIAPESVDTERLNNEQAANAHDGGTGGAQIQAAIDALSSRGGRVRIPSDGPDSVSNGEGVSESAVWEIDAEVATGGKHAVHVEGDSSGWVSQTSGTALVASSAVSRMLTVDGGYLDRVEHLRLDGANTATDGLSLGGDKTNNDFQVEDVMVHDVTDNGIVCDGDKNYWIEDSWIEKTGGPGIALRAATEHVWANELLFFNNSVDFNFGGGGQTIWLDNIRSVGCENYAIGMFGGDWEDIVLSNIYLYECNQSGEQAGIKIDGTGNWYNVNFVNVTVDSTAATNVIQRAGGTLIDCSFWNIQGRNISGDILTGIAGSSNGVRTVVNGHAWNNGNPSTGGDWNGNAKKAVARGVHTVWDDSTSPPTAYIPYNTGSSSGWRAKNYNAA